MLKFALDYHVALDAITGERDELQKYDTEWDISRQLGDILEVFFLFKAAVPS